MRVVTFCFLSLPLLGLLLAWGNAGPPAGAVPGVLTRTSQEPAQLIPTQEWLAHLNTFRQMANLPPVTENPAWSEGAWLHSRYMVKNDDIGHSEDPENPWYTPEGAAAAGNSHVLVSSTTARTDKEAINRWMTGPFHAIRVIDPQLRQVGFGSYREAVGTWHMGATLDVLRGHGSIPEGVDFPIMFPADGTTTPITSYEGGEFPNPLLACPGYQTPTGPPIVLQLDDVPSVSAHAFRRETTLLESCVFDQHGLMNGGLSAPQLLRNVSTGVHAVFLVPRQPLTVGTYTVSITTDDTAYTWSFSVGDTFQARHNVYLAIMRR